MSEQKRRSEDFYDWVITLKKGVATFIVVGTAFQGIDLPGAEEWAVSWKGWMVAVLVACARAGWNYWKHADEPVLAAKNPMMRVLPWLLLPLFFAGCVSTQFTDTITHPDGTVDQTDYGVISAAWPLGKVNETAHAMRYETGATPDVPDRIVIGQDAQGIDNTGMSVLVPLLQSFLDSLAESQRQANESGKTKDLLLEALLQRLDTLPAIP